MSLVRIPGTLETDRLILRHPGVTEAAIYRQLWTERDQRVPPDRLIDFEGRPTVEDIAAQIRAEGSGTGILAVERKGAGDVIGYCGVTSHGNGSLDEPELAYELLRAAQGRSGGGHLGGRGRLSAIVGRGLGLECRVASGLGEARVSRGEPGRAQLRSRPHPADRTRSVNGA